MPKSIRTFIAVHLRATRPLREILDRLQALGRPMRTVAPENLHATLKFLGDTDPAAVSGISRIVEAAARTAEPFELRMVGLGVFPDARAPKVVWAGLANAETLARLTSDLESAMKPLGFGPDGRAFKPHLTLARVRGRAPRELAPILAAHTATTFGTAHVGSVELYQSDLGPKGSTYTPLFSAELGG
jgi:2'-5' RNA ligase